VRRALLAALCLVLASAANAALPPTGAGGSTNVSYSVWTISGSSVLVKFLLPAPVAHSLSGADLPLLTTRKLGDYMLQHLSVQADGRECPAVDQGYDLGKVDPLAMGADLYGFEILFRCAGMTGLVLHNHAIFARSPGHINFARVEESGRISEQLFSSGHEELTVPDGTPMRAAGFSSYLRLGALHLAVGLDRLCFLLGSLLLIRRRQDAAYA